MTPGEIVSLARSLDLKAISITDHDTVDGVRNVLEDGKLEDLYFLNGVEISSTPPLPFVSSSSFHILGYGINPDDTALNQALNKVKQARIERNPKIIALLNKAGFDISLDEVTQAAGGDVIGRPHMARVLMNKGYVASIKEAFDRYLAKGKPAFVDKYRLDCDEAIRILLRAGGIPVLAHPVSLGLDMKTLSNLIDRLKDLGLMGIEAYYSNHTRAMREQYLRLARDKNLLVTGGSDFHGTYKADISLGTGKGDLKVPFSVFEDVMNRLREIQKNNWRDV
jgi:predicted metal-dependent phosphoesterase TrpH